MSHEEVRQLALALPDSEERDHHGVPSFRCAGRIFATLPDEGHLHVMLEPDDIRAVVRTRGDCCEEKWWGKKLAAVRVELAAAPVELVRDLLHDAHERLVD